MSSAVGNCDCGQVIGVSGSVRVLDVMVLFSVAGAPVILML